MLQGLSVGGEYIGSIAFLAEHARPNPAGLLRQLERLHCRVGHVARLGRGGVATLAHRRPIARLGWRIAFISGTRNRVLGFWLRMGVTESPDFAGLRQAGQVAANPIADVLRRDRRDRHHHRPDRAELRRLLPAFRLAADMALADDRASTSQGTGLRQQHAVTGLVLVLIPLCAALGSRGRRRLIWRRPRAMSCCPTR